MNIQQAVFHYLDDGNTTLVFPTENTARHFLAQYVRKCHTSVLASRAMALDRFMQKFSPKHEQKPSNKYHRLAFVASFLDSHDTGLGYLYKDDFYSYRQRFVSFLSRILPSLVDFEDTGIRSDALYHDLKRLKEEYSKYLEHNNLFEPGWERYGMQFCSGLENDYVLVGFDADVQMQKLMKQLGPVERIRTLCLEDVPVKPYEQYSTEEAELEVLFDRLNSLKRKGVPVEQIIITTPKLEELAPRLERKAREYDVPLSFVKSLKLTDTIPGRYLFAVRRCINENLSFHSLENLLLNAALPFADMQSNRTLIRFMIDQNHQGGTLDFGEDRLQKDLYIRAKTDDKLASALALYKDLKSALGAIRSAHDGDEIIKDIHGLTARLLGNDEFDQGNGSDRDVYSFIFSELGSINRTLKESGLAMDNIFSIFMGEVEKLSYVEQKKVEGIRVYSYGQDYLINVPYRFLIGLDEVNVIQESVAMDFLEDHEVSSRESYDVTDRMLDYYMESSEDLHVSGSVATFTGSANAPIYFVNRNSIRKCDDIEDSLLRLLSKADVKSRDVAKVTALGKRTHDVAAGAPYMEIDPKGVRFSYTSISNYAKCPYMAMLAIELTHKVPENFEPSKQDDRAIGTTLHCAIQSFMAQHFNEYLDESHLEQYKEEIRTCLETELGRSPFDEFTKQSIRGKYLPSLFGVVSIMLSERGKAGFIGTMVPIRNELELDADPSFTGFIDTVVRSNEGDTYLIDYKKGGAEGTYQLILYKRLYEKAFPKDEVSACFFYSMKDACFKSVGKKAAELEKALDQDLEDARDGYREGRWIAMPDKQSCENCRERRVCRRRFNLQ